MVRQEAEQIERLEHADDALVFHHDEPVHAMAQHLRECIADLIRRRDRDELVSREIAHGETIEWRAAKDGALQGSRGKNAETRRSRGIVADEHVGRAMLLELPDDGEDVHCRWHEMRWPQEGFIDAGNR